MRATFLSFLISLGSVWHGLWVKRISWKAKGLNDQSWNVSLNDLHQLQEDIGYDEEKCYVKMFWK